MPRPCDNCIFYRKDYDEFRQQYVDIVKVDGSGPEEHFCPMYDEHIPDGIYHAGESCEHQIEKIEN